MLAASGDGARATLTSVGLILLGAALALLVGPWTLQWPWKAVTNREILCAGLVLLAAGILVPIVIKLYLSATHTSGKPDTTNADANTSDPRQSQHSDPNAQSVDAIVKLICRGTPAERSKALTGALRLLPDLAESDRSRLSAAAQLLTALEGCSSHDSRSLTRTTETTQA